MAGLVALLRGVNVGGHRKVPMADLRAVAGSIGFREAATFIQSGNLVFGFDLGEEAAAARLEEALESRFGFPVDVVVRTAERWRRHAAANPFGAEAEREPDRVVLLVPRRSPAAGSAAALAARAGAGERVEGAGDALWVHYPGGIARSKLAPALIDRVVGSPTTARNWRTVAALRDLLDALEE